MRDLPLTLALPLIQILILILSLTLALALTLYGTEVSAGRRLPSPWCPRYPSMLSAPHLPPQHNMHATPTAYHAGHAACRGGHMGRCATDVVLMITLTPT